MAYNNGFPMNYQQYYPQPMQYNAQPAQYNAQPVAQRSDTQNNSIIWVQGEAGAKSYLVAPNTTVQLWDSESQTIYLKSADASGMPSMKILDYTVRTTETPQISAQTQINDCYVTLNEFNEIKGELSHLKDELKELKEAAKHESK